MAHSYSKAELYKREDNGVPLVDLRDVSSKEAEKRETEVC